MDFEVLADSTVPPLDLDTLRLRDPACKPAFKSSLNDRVWFHVPLSGCGTRYWVSMFPGLMGRLHAVGIPSLMLLLLLSLMERRSLMRMR